MTKLNRVICLLGVLALASLLIVAGRTGRQPKVSPPVITTTSLPNGEVNIAYARYLVGYSGRTPYTWSIASGNLPAGLSISTTGTISGLISGTPTQPGIFSFKVQATDANGLTATQDLSITIMAVLGITTPLPNGEVNIAYSEQLLGYGGVSPCAWSITCGSLPTGLSLDSSTGKITGTPTTAGGPTIIIVQVTDSVGGTADQPLSITIVGAPSITTTSSSYISTIVSQWGSGYALFTGLPYYPSTRPQ